MSTDTIVLPDRATWLDFRKSHIGGSDVASIIGENPNKGCYELWAEKTGQLEPEEVTAEAALWGTIFEAPVADEYARRTNRVIVDPGRWTVRVHGKHDFVAATLDREIISEPRGPGVLEVKTTNFFLGKSWREGAPMMPQIQLQHCLAVTGWDWGALACLVGGQKLEPIDLERNDDLIEQLIDRCCWFWDLVQTRTAPPIDGSESTERTLRRLHPKDKGTTVLLPPDAPTWAQELAVVKAAIKDLEARKKGLQNSLLAAIGDASFGDLPDGSGSFSCLHQSRAGYVVEPSEMRPLLFHQPSKANAAKTKRAARTEEETDGTAEAK